MVWPSFSKMSRHKTLPGVNTVFVNEASRWAVVLQLCQLGDCDRAFFERLLCPFKSVAVKPGQTEFTLTLVSHRS